MRRLPLRAASAPRRRAVSIAAASGAGLACRDDHRGADRQREVREAKAEPRELAPDRPGGAQRLAVLVRAQERDQLRDVGAGLGAHQRGPPSSSIPSRRASRKRYWRRFSATAVL